MAVLTVQNLARTGTNPSYAAAASGGDEFVATPGKTFLQAKNGHSSSQTVTVKSQAIVRPGLVREDFAVTVPANTGDRIIPITDEMVGADGRVQLTYSGVTSLTVGVFQLP